MSGSVQLAVVFPVLMLLTLGIISAGVWVHSRNVAQRAATAAVDVARGSYGSTDEAEQRAHQIAAAGGMTDVDVQIVRTPAEVTAEVSGRATTILDLGLARIHETAAAPRERVSDP